MVQAMIPKSLRPMKFYFSTVYQEIWVGVALTTYAYYKISYGGKKEQQISPLVLAIIKELFSSWK